MLLEYHRSSLLATQAFWRLLLQERVDLVQLTKAFRRIDDMESKADRTYRMVLRRWVQRGSVSPSACGAWCCGGGCRGAV